MIAIRTAPGLAEQVYRAILDEICDGSLPAGTHLVQEQLARRLGVSRQPVQQAMALLKADGVVRESGRRGMRVAALDVDEMRHRYDIRGALDELAARDAARRAGCDRRLAKSLDRRGREILEAGRAAMSAGSIAGQIDRDEAFHELLYKASGNPLLADTAEPHWRFLRRVMGAVLSHAEPAPEIWRQHAEILDAVVSGDAPAASRLAREHVHIATTTLSASLTLAGGHDPSASG
jgi:DNA-binding GntR family transcriptional regulator